MTELERKELKEIKNDNEAFNKDLENNLLNFAKELNSGLGEQMMEEIRKNSSIKVERGFFYRLKVWWRNIKENFKIMFFN